MKKKFLVLTSTILATCMLASCGGEQTYTVTFNSMGGSAVAAATVKSGATIEQPADPTKDKYTFCGWYTEETYNNPYDFSKPVTSSFTLYAKWDSTVTSFEVKTEGKKSFAIGSKLDLLDWKFKIGWSDGTYSDASDEQISIETNKVDMNTPGEYPITVTLKDENDPFSITFKVKVVNIVSISIVKDTGFNKFLHNEKIKWVDTGLTMVETGTDGEKYIFNLVEELDKRYDYDNGVYVNTLTPGKDLKGLITSKYKTAEGKEITCEYPYAVYDKVTPNEIKIDKKPDVTLFTNAGKHLINLNGAEISVRYNETGTRYIDLTKEQIEGLALDSSKLQEATTPGEYSCFVKFPNEEKPQAEYKVTLKDTTGYKVENIVHNEKSDHNVGALLKELENPTELGKFIRKDHVFEAVYKNDAGDSFAIPVAKYDDADVVYDFSQVSGKATVKQVEFKFNSGDANGKSCKYDFTIYDQDQILVDGKYMKYFPDDNIYSAHHTFEVKTEDNIKKYYLAITEKDEFTTNDYVLRSDIPFSHPDDVNNVTSLNFIENTPEAANGFNINFDLKKGTLAGNVTRSGENGHYYIRVNPNDTANFMRFMTVNGKLTKELYSKLAASGKVCYDEKGEKPVGQDDPFTKDTDIYIVFKQQDGTGQPFLGTFENKAISFELHIYADHIDLYDVQRKEITMNLHYQFTKSGNKINFVTNIAGITLIYENDTITIFEPGKPEGGTFTRKN